MLNECTVWRILNFVGARLLIKFKIFNQKVEIPALSCVMTTKPSFAKIPPKLKIRCSVRKMYCLFRIYFLLSSIAKWEYEPSRADDVWLAANTPVRGVIASLSRYCSNGSSSVKLQTTEPPNWAVAKYRWSNLFLWTWTSLRLLTVTSAVTGEPESGCKSLSAV